MSFTAIPINSDEARALVRHWAREREEFDQFWAAWAQAGGDDRRSLTRIAEGIEQLCGAGLLTEDECRSIFEEAHAENVAFWEEFEAAGRAVGFYHDRYFGSAPAEQRA